MNTSNFRTELFIKPSAAKISLSSKIFSIGSCFADVMGNRLAKNKFNVSTNPFGIIFNPVSIQNIFQIIKNKKKYNYQNNDIDKTIFIERDENFFHYDFHSQITAPSANELQDLINKKITDAYFFLSNIDFVIITLGTSFVYKHLQTDNYVANCHKMPSNLFKKELLSIEKINFSLNTLIENIKDINSNCKIIFTVSPVRHIKDTIELNQVSKSMLRIACNEAVEKNTDVVSYFPSYELMIDDLRDYRFYKEDMIHPNEVAEDYIWNKFAESYFGEDTHIFLKKWNAIEKLLNHKFFKVGNEKYYDFVSNTLSELYSVSEQVDVSKEIEEWEIKLSAKKINI